VSREAVHGEDVSVAYRLPSTRKSTFETAKSSEAAAATVHEEPVVGPEMPSV